MSLETSTHPAVIDSSVAASRLDIVPARGDAEAPAGTAPGLDVPPASGFPDRSRTGRAPRLAALAAAVAAHGCFAALAALLIGWRDIVSTPERAIPIEIVTRMPEVPAPAPIPAPPVAPLLPKEVAPPPQLAAPPPEAAPAAQPQPSEPADTAEDSRAAERTPPASPSAEVPKVLTAREAVLAVPPPAPPPPDAFARIEPTPEGARIDPAAQLRAALPMDTSALPRSFRAVLSGGGTQASDDYKGVVYGKLGHSQGPVERARALNLRGQVMVAFSIDDAGQVTELRVARSSGAAALDALALDMVREATPFPPPPSNARRAFMPVLSFGMS